MPLANTPTSYGRAARALHWLTALLILTTFPLGLLADNLPQSNAQEVALKTQLFSVHKTLGVTAFFVALARILWALCQPHPAPVHPERRLETFVAAVVHWMLYGALVLVPLSGWVKHAALDGFAPILWPFGQGLPLVPKSEALADAAGAGHWLFTKILLVALALHVAGALKHALFDRDGVMARMTRGAAVGRPGTAPGAAGPLMAALLLWAGAIFGAVQMAAARAPVPAEGAAPATPAAATVAAGSWQVQQGTLDFTVFQIGQAVTGSFAAWTAEIAYDPDTGSGKVTVSIDTASLTLSAVTEQAKAPEFFDVAAHPTATFTADITRGADGHVATGTLALRGVTLPVSLPFTLTIEGDSATMQGQVALDRRDYGMGASYGDEATVGFAVTVDVALTAQRVP